MEFYVNKKYIHLVVTFSVLTSVLGSFKLLLPSDTIIAVRSFCLGCAYILNLHSFSVLGCLTTSL